MLSEEIIARIKNGEIKSRRQLYTHVRKSKELIQYLNDNQIMMPKQWTKEMFNYQLKFLETSGKSILANDNKELWRVATRFYGTWDNALEAVLHKTNQYMYTEMTDSQLLDTIRNYIIKYKRLPLRSEFDGRSYEYPYFESIISRFKVKRFSDLFKMIDLKDVKYYHDINHGTGKIRIDDNGVVYLSNQEYLIGKYLNERGIKFEKEVPYGNCGYIFDFYIPQFNVYIEYYGLATTEYKKRISERQKMYNGRKVIEIYKHENTIKKLDLEVQRL